MDALASAARAWMHAQATVRRKCPLWKKTKAGDKRGFKGIAPWKEKPPKDSFVKNYKRIVRSDRFFMKRDAQFNQAAGDLEIKIYKLSKLRQVPFGVSLLRLL